MNKEHWWNNTDRGKLRYSEENLFQGHSAHRKLHTSTVATHVFRVSMFLLTVTVARPLGILQVGYHKFHFYEVRGFRARHRRRMEDNINP